MFYWRSRDRMQLMEFGFTREEIGRLLVEIGAFCFIFGAILTHAPWIVSWFGKLPGDFKASGERWAFYFPLTSMLLIAVVLSLFLNFVGKFIR